MANKVIKVEWCKNWIKKSFAELPEWVTGIEITCFWKMAEESELWIPGTYGSPMSKALEELVNVIPITDNGNFLYNVFRLKEVTDERA